MLDNEQLNRIRAAVGHPPENLRTVGWVTARVASARFPGKVYLELCGKPMWWHILQRVELGARLAGVELSNVFICTSADASNDILERQARQYGYDCFRWDGPEWNVSGRYVAAMRHYDAGIGMHASGDCPLCWYDLTKLSWEAVSAYNHALEPTWRYGDPNRAVAQVLGLIVVWPAWEYEMIEAMAQTQDEFEHSGLIWTRDWDRRPHRLYTMPRGVFRDYPKDFFDYHRWYRLDVDTYQDAVQMSEIYGHFYEGKPIDPRVVIDWIDKHEEYHRNAAKSESAVNQQVKGSTAERAEWRFLDYAESYLCPDNAPRLYCAQCGAYLGYVAQSHSVQHLHRPDGTVITGTANITCPNRHFRTWQHTWQHTVAAGSAVMTPPMELEGL